MWASKSKTSSRKPGIGTALGILGVLAAMNRRNVRLSGKDILELLVALRSPGRIVRLATLAHFFLKKRREARAASGRTAAR